MFLYNINIKMDNLYSINQEIYNEILEYSNENNTFREKNKVKLGKLISKKKAELLEKSIFDYSIVYVTNKLLNKNMSINVYNDKYYELYNLLDKNSNLYNKNILDNLKKNNKYILSIPFLEPHELYPDNWNKIIEKIKLKEYKKNNIDATDLYRCSKCGERRCKITQQQTRSADEPMTVFVVCLVCGNTFKH
mgnify:CR=1 FL=1